MNPDDPLYYINQHYAALQEEARKIRLNRLRTMLKGTSVDIEDVLSSMDESTLKDRIRRQMNEQFGSQGIGSQTIGGNANTKTAPKWNNIQEMMRDLSKLPKTPAKPVVNKQSRIQEIEDELDIIRGRKPTPKGYKVDPSKVKALMTELKELKAQ